MIEKAVGTIVFPTALCYNFYRNMKKAGIFMDEERFSEICLRYRESIRVRSGIGTLGEKTLHAILKDYFEPNPEYQ